MNVRNAAEDLCPPMLWRALRKFRRLLRRHFSPGGAASHPKNQELAIYWTPQFAQILETWGEDNAWAEIQLLLCHCRGKVLDIACGTGKVIQINSRFPQLEIHGCDISDFLIEKARERGIPPERLRICNATNTGFADEEFDYSYSIGSLEHFTDDGIGKFLAESYRITHNASFHHIPVSRGGVDYGWITPHQSYFNNSVTWWLPKFQSVYPTVHVLHSAWEDENSIGKWFICLKLQ